MAPAMTTMCVSILHGALSAPQSVRLTLLTHSEPSGAPLFCEGNSHLARRALT